jgi:hypothetical protein
MVTVWQGNPMFAKYSIAPVFLDLGAVIVGIGLIEGFSQIWRTRIIWSFQRHVLTQVSFNSHNAHCYFPCTAHLFVYQENMDTLQLSPFVLIAHELCHFGKN